ncbi:DUF4124 domain-containing protein [Thiocystis violacea]|uniref:DUF4124 domain-containing protein n=1 Tax=Thiocystis violacea TaxID=13725 RepID=UPI0019047EB6|nr:DUF4124 domain-containing protein [Thiocystis violacea]
MFSKFLILAIGLVCVNSTAFSQYYECRGLNGMMSYQDFPCPNGSSQQKKLTPFAQALPSYLPPATSVEDRTLRSSFDYIDRQYETTIAEASMKNQYGSDVVPSGYYNFLPGESVEDYKERIRKYFEEHATFADKASLSIDKASSGIGSSIKDVAGFFDYSDYCDCIIEEMAGTQNDVAAKSVISECKKQASEFSCENKKGSWFGIKNKDECITKHARAVSSPVGAKEIQKVCGRAYGS